VRWADGASGPQVLEQRITKASAVLRELLNSDATRNALELRGEVRMRVRGAGRGMSAADAQRGRRRAACARSTRRS
jgi:hypothetical protein